jgi:hypothetical protein
VDVHLGMFGMSGKTVAKFLSMQCTRRIVIAVALVAPPNQRRQNKTVTHNYNNNNKNKRSLHSYTEYDSPVVVVAN